jgi:glyoxylase-like metal-dependent hydrolase (beta-lactamase superfamily II)
VTGLVHRTVSVGPFQCNCHVLMDEATREAVIVDPGDEPGRILEIVKDLGASVTALLHTHCHLDHIIGTRRMKEETGGTIHIHVRDRSLYEGLKEQFRSLLRLFGFSMGEGEDPLPVDGLLEDGQAFRFGGQEMKVIHTPGHTPGSCCFAMETPKDRVLFSGDTLFAGSIGRTDLWGGDYDQEIASIQRKLLVLDGDTIVYPGHGPRTRIKEEKRENPYVGE